MMGQFFYRIDADGTVRGLYSEERVHSHPVGEMAKIAPVSFKKCAAQAIASASTSPEFIIRDFTRNKEMFGLTDENVADILHYSISLKSDEKDKIRLSSQIFFRNCDGQAYSRCFH